MIMAEPFCEACQLNVTKNYMHAYNLLPSLFISFFNLVRVLLSDCTHLSTNTIVARLTATQPYVNSYARYSPPPPYLQPPSKNKARHTKTYLWR